MSRRSYNEEEMYNYRRYITSKYSGHIIKSAIYFVKYKYYERKNWKRIQSMPTCIITVATEEEKKALIPEKYHDRVVITGIGFYNTMCKLRSLKPKMVINIGYAGANKIQKGTICQVSKCEAYHTHNLDLGAWELPQIECELPSYRLYSSTDFLDGTELEHPFLVDMELLAHSVLHCPVMSIKVVSDNMNMDDYEEALSKDEYKYTIDLALSEIGELL